MNLDLSQRAVACGHWKWSVGMRVYSPYYQVYYRIVSVDRHDWCLVLDGTGMGAPVVQYRELTDTAKEPFGVCTATPLFDWQDNLLPDFEEATTKCCLLELVRKAWNDPTLCCVFDHDDGNWHVGRWEDGLALRGRAGKTEVEALVSALEAAP